MPSNRQLVPLADYDAALDEVSYVGTILGLLALVFLLLTVAGALPHVARNVPPGPDRWWLALLVHPLVMAVGSPMVLWLVGSCRRNMRQVPLLVCPTCQQVPWSSHAVRLTGCCDRCSQPMVELPSASGPMAKSASELMENQRTMMRGFLGFLCVGLCVFGLAVVVFWFTENLTHLAMGGAAFFVVFLPGLVLVDRRSNHQTFECPNCKVDLRKNPRTVPWNSTTGRCAKCAHVALAVREPVEAENKLSLAKLRKRQDFRGEWGVWPAAPVHVWCSRVSDDSGIRRHSGPRRIPLHDVVRAAIVHTTHVAGHSAGTAGPLPALAQIDIRVGVDRHRYAQVPALPWADCRWSQSESPVRFTWLMVPT